MREKEEWERVGEENIQVFNIENIQVYNTWKKKARMGLEPTSSALQWWLNVTMVAFNLPSKLSQICSSTTSKKPTQNPSKDE
jgi:hypothetical protein